MPLEKVLPKETMKSILYYRGKNYNNKEIAIQCNCSDKTIGKYLKKFRNMPKKEYDRIITALFSNPEIKVKEVSL